MCDSMIPHPLSMNTVTDHQLAPFSQFYHPKGIPITEMEGTCVTIYLPHPLTCLFAWLSLGVSKASSRLAFARRLLIAACGPLGRSSRKCA